MSRLEKVQGDDFVCGSRRRRCLAESVPCASWISKGQGCTQRLKEHMDGSLRRIKWERTTHGLEEGVDELLQRIHQEVD